MLEFGQWVEGSAKRAGAFCARCGRLIGDEPYFDSIAKSSPVCWRCRVSEMRCCHRETMAERDGLRNALRPFAALYDKCLDQRPDDTPLFALNDAIISVGDIRRAKQALGG